MAMVQKLLAMLVCTGCCLPCIGGATPLGVLVLEALQSHPSIAAQRAQAQSAGASLDSANWQFFPTPSVLVEKASARASDRLYQGDSSVSTMRLQQPLWTGGRLTAGVDKAEAGVAASEAGVEEARLQIAARVIQTYGEWLAAHLRIQAGIASLAAHERLRDQVQRRIAEGGSALSDLTLAVTRLQAVQAEVLSSRVQADIALSRLRQLLGRALTAAQLESVSADARPAMGDVQSLLDQAKAINPGILKARAQARVQEALVSERRADLAPELYARIERQYGNYAFSNAPPENRLFVGLSTRFGAGLSSSSNTEVARRQHQAALAEIESQERAASEQVLADYALVASSQARMAALNASMESAKEVSLSYDRQFLAGRKSWLDVMNAARELAQTESQLAELRATRMVASWRLDLYTRGIGVITGEAR